MTTATRYMPSPTAPSPIPPPRAAADQLVRAHLRGVWRFLRLLGCAPFEADDLTQETFVVALQKDLGDRSSLQVASFLRRTARHLFLRSREQRDRRAELLADVAERVFAAACGDDGGDRRVDALRTCLQELGERPRRIVRMFYGERRSRQDIAAELAMQEAGVKTALQRLRDALKQCMQRRMS